MLPLSDRMAYELKLAIQLWSPCGLMSTWSPKTYVCSKVICGISPLEEPWQSEAL